MPKQQRHKTEYVGVYYIEGSRGWKTGDKRKPERIYYITYRRDGKVVEEKAGRQFKDDMTPARASLLRAERIKGEPTNRARREAESNKWPLDRLWAEYNLQFPDRKAAGNDSNRYKIHLAPTLGTKDPSDLTMLDVERLRLNLSKTRSPVTVVNVLSLLKRIINYGVKYHGHQPLSFRIKIPKVTSQKTESLTDEELKNLMKALDSTRLVQAAAMMKMALYTGMRKGEIFKLKWEDVDLDRGFITIRNPKGGKDMIVPINDPAKKLLESVERTESAYVFPGADGGPRKDAQKQMNQIRDAAGLPKSFRAMHGLRHAYASMLASSGVDLYTVGRLLTHKSTNMTVRYAHLSDKAMRAASELVGNIVKKTEERR